jgi:hypothetical protein
MPLSQQQTNAAIELAWEPRALLENAPATGRYSVAHLLVRLLNSDRALVILNKDLRALEAFDVRGPEQHYTFLGLTWAEILADEGQRSR